MKRIRELEDKYKFRVNIGKEENVAEVEPKSKSTKRPVTATTRPSDTSELEKTI